MTAPPPFQRETLEFLPINVWVNGTAVTAAVEATIVELGARPTTWGTAVTLGTAIGVTAFNEFVRFVWKRTRRRSAA